MSLQLFFKRVNAPRVSKARWQSILYCSSSMGKDCIAKGLPCLSEKLFVWFMKSTGEHDAEIVKKKKIYAFSSKRFNHLET